MLKAKKGYYVVKTEDQWVYDVEVYSNDDLIAVVGFTQKQKEGAVFWQVPLEKPLNYDYKHIQFIARTHFENNK
tara:strand:+ start:15988 stop:16209 length:222 start_codon:yes stop_codon:yes gene_type:complete